VGVGDKMIGAIIGDIVGSVYEWNNINMNMVPGTEHLIITSNKNAVK
jgi:ADP-ribosylglycohydrolase